MVCIVIKVWLKLCYISLTYEYYSLMSFLELAILQCKLCQGCRKNEIQMNVWFFNCFMKPSFQEEDDIPPSTLIRFESSSIHKIFKRIKRILRSDFLLASSTNDIIKFFSLRFFSSLFFFYNCYWLIHSFRLLGLEIVRRQRNWRNRWR